MTLTRASGVLVHPTSFPSRCGIGDLGTGARRVLDFLAAGHQRLWQILPLGPTGFGDSPYASFSAFAGNHYLIAPEMLVEQGWLRDEDLAEMPALPESAVDYGHALPRKMALLRRAFEEFEAGATASQRAECDAFAAANRSWLDDYTLFMALKHAHGDQAWTEWRPDLVARQPQALEEARTALAEEVRLHTFLQWNFFTQWDALRDYAGVLGISVIGDVPIFVAHDSADVWTHPDLFFLDAHGRPTVVAGVPPDYFSRTGQRWGNPLYRWDALAHSGYSWWIERVRAARRIADILRLDHFRGFQAYWEVPAAARTAERGRWVRAPGADLFRAVSDALGDVPLIAEDLGKITPPVRRLRESLGLPGMKVLQFAFGSDAHNEHLPHHYTHDMVVYTGTHDNDTTLAWFETRDHHERGFIQRYVGTDGREIHWDLMRLALASVADTAIIPLQDVLGLGRSARMNTPGTSSGNWAWRCTDAQLVAETSDRLAQLTTTYGR